MTRLDPVDLMDNDEFDRMLGAWSDPARPLSSHLSLSIAAAHHREARGLRPLIAGEPVPGCDCPACTGVAADAPARRPVRKLRPRRDLAPAIDVDAARAVGIIEIARRLDLGEPRRAGKELLIRCPLHEDSRPSMRIDPARNVWYCDPCGEGGDGIRLWQRARGLAFLDACRELAA